MFEVEIKSKLALEAYDLADYWLLLAVLAFSHPLCGDREVPVGFKTDLASIPPFFRRIFSVNGRHRRAAVIHDWLYSILGQFPAFKLTRKQCDQIFLDFLKHEGVSLWRRQAIYSAVRMFGGIHLNSTIGRSWES